MSSRERTRASVTVLIPTRNRAQLLRGALDSVLAQTFTDFSVLVSDNASDDDTRAMVESIEDPRVRYSRSERDVGLVGNFNRCLDQADGDYLLVLCDDDQLRPDHLATTVPVLDENPSVGVVYTAVDKLGAHGELVEPAASWNGLDTDLIEPSIEFIRRSMSTYHSRLALSSSLIRASAIPADGFREIDGVVCDLGLWLRVGLDHDIAFVAQPLAGLRVHEGAASASAERVHGGGYVQGADVIERTRDMKLELIDTHQGELVDPRSLRAEARRSTRRQLLVRVWELTTPERPLGGTVRLLGESARIEPRLLLETGTWRLLAGAMLPARVLGRLERRGAGLRDDTSE
ncbi:MAG: glycosyltransferase family 2 protein [Gaiellales bacterium]